MQKNLAVSRRKASPQFSLSCGFGGAMKPQISRKGAQPVRNQCFPRFRALLLSLRLNRLGMRKTWHWEATCG